MTVEHQLYEFGDFRLDVARQTLYKKTNPLKLKGLPMKLLVHLVRNREIAIPKQEVLNLLWPGETGDLESRLKNVCDRLYSALGDTDRPDHPVYIRRDANYFYFLVPVHAVSVQAPNRNSARNKLLALSSGLAIVAVIVVLYFLYRVPEEPSIFSIDGRLLTVFDAHNRKLWDYVLPIMFATRKVMSTEENLAKRHKFVDIYGDGRKELLFGFADVLYCLRGEGGHGKVVWTYPPGRQVTTRQGQVLPAQYAVELVETLRKPRADGGMIIVGAHRGPGGLFVVELLTKDHRKVAEYFHLGWFFTVETGVLDENGREDIFLGGVDSGPGVPNGYGATLVILDSDTVEGQAATYTDSDLAIKNLPVGKEKAVLLIKEFAPNSHPHLYCRVAHITLAQDSVELQVTQGDSEQPNAHFRFDRHLKLQGITPDIKLEKLLDLTILKNLPPVQRQETMQKALGDIQFIRNGFAKSGAP